MRHGFWSLHRLREAAACGSSTTMARTGLKRRHGPDLKIKAVTGGRFKDGAGMRGIGELGCHWLSM